MIGPNFLNKNFFHKNIKLIICVALFSFTCKASYAEESPVVQDEANAEVSKESIAKDSQQIANAPGLTNEQKQLLQSLPPELIKEMEEVISAAQQSTDANSNEKMLQQGQLNFENAVPEIPNSLPYVNELEAMKREQRETLQLKQQIEAEKLRAELLKLQGGAGREGSSPYVINLTGINKMRQARIMLPTFGEITVKKGDKLPDGWEIIDITDSAVIASKDENRIQLPFYARPK